MTVRERKLLVVLLLLLCIVSIYHCFCLKMDNINCIQEIHLTREKINKLENLTEEKNIKEDIAFSELMNLIFDELKQFKMIPFRYNNSKGFIEVFIKTSEYDLYNYLLSKLNYSSNYFIDSFWFKESKGSIEVRIRYVPDNCIYTSKKFEICKEKILSNINTYSCEQNNVVEEKKIQNGDEIFKIIGSIKSKDNVGYLYIKKLEGGKILKVSEKEIDSVSNNSYIIKIDGIYYEIEK